MKARQHRKTVQRRMGHWVAGAPWRRVMAHCAELTSSLADGALFAKHPANFGDPTVPWPWDILVIDESSEFVSLAQPRTTSYLKAHP